jgi:signal transduction histidine kinase
MSAIASMPVRRWPERRRLILVTAALLFIGVFLIGEESGKTAVLYAVPVALVSLELGLSWGFAAAAISVAALALSTGAVGVIAGGVALACVGLVAGRFGDRMRDVQRRQQRLLSSGLVLAQLEAGGQLSEVLARRILELTGAQGARVELLSGEVAEAGEYSHRAEQARVAIDVRHEQYGSLSVSGVRPLAPEDRVSLQILALQTAVVAESRRLLERRAQLRELLNRQEAERHHVAHELHEDAAQMLAAALLSVGALERELDGSQRGPRLGELRVDIDSTLRSLRSLAASLRPPALELGLGAALEQLAEEARGRHLQEVAVSLDGLHDLNPETETMVYRVAQEALDVAGSGRTVLIEGRGADCRIEIVVEGLPMPIDPAQLAVLEARVELAGGTLSYGSGELRAVLPAFPGGAPCVKSGAELRLTTDGQAGRAL